MARCAGLQVMVATNPLNPFCPFANYRTSSIFPPDSGCLHLLGLPQVFSMFYCSFALCVPATVFFFFRRVQLHSYGHSSTILMDLHSPSLWVWPSHLPLFQLIKPSLKIIFFYVKLKLNAKLFAFPITFLTYLSYYVP